MPKPIIVVEEEVENESDDFIPGPLGPLSERQTSNQLDISTTRRSLGDSVACKRGNGTLASRSDLEMPSNEFAEGCKLLQQAALGKEAAMEVILKR